MPTPTQEITNRHSSLRRLASLYGVQTSYYDVAHRRRLASPEALRAVLQALGAPLATWKEVPAALRERQQAMWQRPLEPVAVAWEGQPVHLDVRLPAHLAGDPLAGELCLEAGERISLHWRGAELPVVEQREIEGVRYVRKLLPLPPLPWGYHRLTLQAPGGPAAALVLSAPLRAHGLQDKMWGVFLPLYALHTERSWGGGDLSDLEALATWVAGAGGGAVATLPLLPTFLDNSHAPSPFAPVSRLLWSEFYLDVTKVPELERCPTAQALLASAVFQRELRALRRAPVVDYSRQMALKRQVFERLARSFFASTSDSPQRYGSFRRFLEENPQVSDYACFRATMELRSTPWRLWPQPLRDGVLREGDYQGQTKRYHLYVQWLTQQQLHSVSHMAHEKGVRLYLDLPLGVHPDGYDAWRHQNLFAEGMSTGAPPDAFFALGQNWGFPPMKPEALRQDGYTYVLQVLRHHLRHAQVLRLDHVMGLHRLFWIPRGMEAHEGVYVRYPAEELYALLTLESHRHKAAIVGEDLGTVPPQVRPTMTRHGLYRTYVQQFGFLPDPRRAIQRVPAAAVASLNTHDMAPFAAFWHGLDIQDRRRLGLLDRAGAREERKRRQAVKVALVHFLGLPRGTKGPSQTLEAVIKALLAFLARSPARIVLVNLEDLWSETHPQNVPGTLRERPNWQRKARYSLEGFFGLPHVVDTLREIDQLRRH